jgi:hypothetical protein
MNALITEAEVITTGRTVLARIGADDFSWPSDEAGRVSLRACRDGLTETLEVYEDIEAGRIQPASEFPELAGDDEAYGTALRKLADDVLAWARAAVMVVGEHCGQEAAEALSAAEDTSKKGEAG